MGKKHVVVDVVVGAIRDRHGISTNLAFNAFRCAFYDIYGCDVTAGEVVAERDVENLMAGADLYLEPTRGMSSEYVYVKDPTGRVGVVVRGPYRRRGQDWVDVAFPNEYLRCVATQLEWLGGK